MEKKRILLACGLSCMILSVLAGLYFLFPDSIVMTPVRNVMEQAKVSMTDLTPEEAARCIREEFATVMRIQDDEDNVNRNPLTNAVYGDFLFDVQSLTRKTDTEWTASCLFSNHDASAFLTAMEDQAIEGSYDEVMTKMMQVYHDTPKKTYHTDVSVFLSEETGFYAKLSEENVNYATGEMLSAFQLDWE